MILKFLLILLIIYAVVFVFVIIIANRFIFFPPAPGYKDSDPNIIKLTLPDGLQISAIYLHNPNAKYTLLYSHGNAEDLGTVRHRLPDLVNAGFSVLSYDYPGYGKSKGRPSESVVYESIFAAYNYLTKDLCIDPSHIIAYGFSVGCGPTLELATKKPVAAVILQGPFLSAFRVVTRVKVFPWDIFDNYKKVAHIKAPLLIFHGNDDEIVPYYHGKALWEKAPAPKTFLEIPEADHNYFLHLAGQRYWDALQKFVNSL